MSTPRHVILSARDDYFILRVVPNEAPPMYRVVCQIYGGWQNASDVLRALDAQGIEAAPAAETQSGSVHESPVGAEGDDAPKGSQP